MIRFLTINLVAFSAIALQLSAQVLPREDSRLHYRLIGFSFPAEKKVSAYRIEIAAGNYTDDDNFTRNVLETEDGKTNKIIAEVPYFGWEYTWRVITTHKNGNVSKSKLFHFATKMSPNVDPCLNRLRIIKSAEKYRDAYVFLDGARALFDMNGQPIWFLPDIDTFVNENCEPRDMKLTPQGTITFLVHDKAYDISYDGRILWMGPNNGLVSGDSEEHYHHELTRLSNGHYIVMGTETVNEAFVRSPDVPTDTVLTILPKAELKSASYYALNHLDVPVCRQNQYATVIEYGEANNIVWSYKSSKYFNGSDLIFHKRADGTPDTKVHDNGFYFDEKNEAVYLSFRDISRIVKIKYPDGTTLHTYGEIFKKGVAETGNNLFCSQHCVRRSQHGYLYMFNNNSCYPGALPKITILQERQTGDESLEKIWEYECQLEEADKPLLPNLNFSSGGSVQELPDSSMFVSMSSGYSKVFVVNRDKQILWSAMMETWNTEDSKWRDLSLYRGSMIVDKKELEVAVFK